MKWSDQEATITQKLNPTMQPFISTKINIDTLRWNCDHELYSIIIIKHSRRKRTFRQSDICVSQACTHALTRIKKLINFWKIWRLLWSISVEFNFQFSSAHWISARCYGSALLMWWSYSRSTVFSRVFSFPWKSVCGVCMLVCVLDACIFCSTISSALFAFDNLILDFKQKNGY